MKSRLGGFRFPAIAATFFALVAGQAYAANPDLYAQIPSPLITGIAHSNAPGGGDTQFVYFASSVGTYLADGSYIANAANTGDIGGINQVAIVNFKGVDFTGYTIRNAVLYPYVTNASGNPLVSVASFAAVPTSYQQAFGIAPTGSFTAYSDMGSGVLVANLASQIQSQGLNGIHLAFTSGTIGLGGAGVPGPVAGAGLPVLALALALAWVARRKSCAA